MNVDVDKNRLLSSGNNILSKIAKNFFLKGKTETSVPGEVNEAEELVESIKAAKNEWMSANTNFEFAEEQELVDYYTYKIKACEVRYEYLLKKAKEKGIRIETYAVDKIVTK